MRSPYAVLYVDDEVANLHAFRLGFEEYFDVITTTSGKEALELIERGNIGVLLADERMPEMAGSELCAAVQARRPDVVRMIVTAYSDISAVLRAVNQGQVSRYFIKPWREEEMIQALSAALEVVHLAQITREIQARLLQKEQQATAAFLVGRVLHEIGNPVTALRTNLSFLADSITQLAEFVATGSAEAPRLASELVPSVEEAVTIVDDIVARMELLRRGDARPSLASAGVSGLDRAVQVGVSLLKHEIKKRARIIIDTKVRPRVALEQSRLTQIVVNLLTNACEAIPEGNAIDNSIKVTTFVRGDRAGMSVEDTGVGIDPAAGDRIFDPFVSTKGDGGGRGLGLAVVRDIVDKSGGTIIAQPGDGGRGTRFVVELPLAP